VNDWNVHVMVDPAIFSDRDFSLNFGDYNGQQLKFKAVRRLCRITVIFIHQWLVVAFLCISAVLIFGCHPLKSTRPFVCPAGDLRKGAAPPSGEETWCEKIVNGEPVKDGPFVLFGENGGKIIEGGYRDGLQEGDWTMWYANGQRSAIDHYHDGLQDGLHISWYANGQKAIEGEYRAGKREGVWTSWDPSGLTSKRQVYRNDRAVR
jgi:hypothetical protein